MHNPPIFVVGALRSGTTLLRLLMDHHSQINVFGEFEAAVAACDQGQFPDINRFHQYLEVDRQTTTYQLKIDKTLDYPGLVRNLFEQMRERSSKPHVGACIHSNIHMIPKLWPKAKFIFLVRDPRDVARSCIGMGWVGNVYNGSDYWLDAVSKYERLKSSINKEQIFELRYEDLVAEPEDKLSEICNFLGVNYEEGMLDIQDDSTYERPNSQFSYQWKNKLSARDVELVEYRCHRLMEKYNYPLAHNPPKAPGALEKLFLYTDNRLKRLRFSINRWGLANWFFYILSKKLPNKTFKRNMQMKINNINKMHLK